jgi:alpha-ribazole phosphatase
MAQAISGTTAFWLLRHPQPEAGARGRCYGSLDVALSAEGVRQARAVAASLQMEPIAAVYTSPRRRCRQAAEMLARGRCCPVRTLEAIRELDFGEFEGRTYEEIAGLYPDLYRQWMERPTEVKFPGGESFREMCARVTQAAAMLRKTHAGEPVALMTHGGVIRILLAEALAMPPENIFRIGQRYGAVNLIRYPEECPVVELVNGDPEARFHPEDPEK